ncbi:MAG TPA: DNA polymerase III subunit gamma/tau [Quisquiliibacterium sp.]|nr:DNA polymerase III subunit gamma/tau [Quisquiliibacterium sp.]
MTAADSPRDAHQVLARKWRPRDFQSLVGQEHVVRALTHALDTRRLHHAYLFTGTRGVGKTTIARILAKSLNCETGVSSRPCGVCTACTEIDQGRHPDYLELDAASNRGVDEMTQLLENAVYAPSAGAYKVYVIDEVHMLSTHAFNAMLKTLEEPPPHVVFILATTDPQKVPVTVLSRCLQFNLKNMAPAAVARHLATVLEAEGIAFEPAALTLIGRSAAGSMRDALSLLDQAIAFSAGQVGEQAVREMLGAVDREYLSRLLDALIAGDGRALVGVADEMAAANAPFARVLAELAAELQRIALAQVGAFGDDADTGALARYAQAIAPEDLQVYYQIVIHGGRDLALAPDELTGFTMTLLRLLAFRPADDDAASAGRAAGGPAAHARGAGPGAPAGSHGPVPGAGASAPGARQAPVDRALPPPQAQASPARPPANDVAAARAAALAAVAGARGGRSSLAPPAPGPVRNGAPLAAAPAVPPVPLVPAVPAAPGTPARPVAPSSSAPRAAPSAASGRGSAESPPPWDEDSEPQDGPPAWLDAPERAASASEDAATASERAAPAPERAAPVRDLRSGPGAGAAAEAPAAAAGAASVADAGASFDGDWPGLALRLPVVGLARQFMQQSELVAHDDRDGLEFRVRVPVKALAEAATVGKVRDALSTHFGATVRLTVETGAVGSATAASVVSRQRAERLSEARSAIEADPFVRTLIDDFDGRIVPDSVRPVDD